MKPADIGDSAAGQNVEAVGWCPSRVGCYQGHTTVVDVTPLFLPPGSSKSNNFQRQRSNNFVWSEFKEQSSLIPASSFSIRITSSSVCTSASSAPTSSSSVPPLLPGSHLYFLDPTSTSWIPLLPGSHLYFLDPTSTSWIPPLLPESHLCFLDPTSASWILPLLPQFPPLPLSQPSDVVWV